MITSHINQIPGYFRGKLSRHSQASLSLRVWPREKLNLELPNPNKNFQDIMKLKYNDIGPKGIEFTPPGLIIRCDKCDKRYVVHINKGEINIIDNCKECYKVFPPKQSKEITFVPKKNVYWY